MHVLKNRWGVEKNHKDHELLATFTIFFVYPTPIFAKKKIDLTMSFHYPQKCYKTPEEVENSSEEMVDIYACEKTDDVIFAPTEGSEVVEFFKNKSVFVTGATGFLGQLLVEKLLRSCPDIEGVYVLVRGKKGKSVRERVDALLDGEVFQHVSKKCPKFREKVVAVEGDAALPRLGLNNSDWENLKNKINIIFHVAATVRFNEELDEAVKINVFGTKSALDLAKACKNLDAFVYVSTAYSQCPKKYIEEATYSCPHSPDELMERMHDKDFNQKTQYYLGTWPNSYSFSKALAENVLKSHGNGLPISIIRPGIVTSTHREPLRCWINNLYGPMGALIGVAVGLIRTFHVDNDKHCEIVPADFVTNATICCAYDSKKNATSDVKVYNYVPSPVNPIIWGDFCRLNKVYGYQTPTKKSIWYVCVTYTKHLYVHLFLTFFLHFVPAFLIDAYLVLRGKKPRLISIYKKIFTLNSSLAYFCTREWQFEYENVQKLWSNLSELDKGCFPFSLEPEHFNWNVYIKPLCLGIRKYMMREDISTLPEATRTIQRLFLYHQILRAVFFVIMLKIIYEIVLWFF